MQSGLVSAISYDGETVRETGDPYKAILIRPDFLFLRFN
jgi:hypothetical protein